MRTTDPAPHYFFHPSSIYTTTFQHNKSANEYGSSKVPRRTVIINEIQFKPYDTIIKRKTMKKKFHTKKNNKTFFFSLFISAHIMIIA